MGDVIGGFRYSFVARTREAALNRVLQLLDAIPDGEAQEQVLALSYVELALRASETDEMVSVDVRGHAALLEVSVREMSATEFVEG